jgi:hypothetical protein
VVVALKARAVTDKLKQKTTNNKQVNKAAMQWSQKVHQEVLRLGADVEGRQLLVANPDVLEREPLLPQVHCLQLWTPTAMV